MGYVRSIRCEDTQLYSCEMMKMETMRRALQVIEVLASDTPIVRLFRGAIFALIYSSILNSTRPSNDLGRTKPPYCFRN